MASITPTEFKARFPEFATIADARIQIFIDDSELEMSESYWGDLFARGQSYLTAHLLALGEQSATGASGGTAGPVTSKSVGGVSVSFGGPTITDSTEGYWLTTSYGQEYWRLLQQIGLGWVIVD